jgi:hypothetical protein
MNNDKATVNLQESATEAPVSGVTGRFVDELNEGIFKINSVLEKYSIPNVKKTIFPMIAEGKLKIFVSPEVMSFLSGIPVDQMRYELLPALPQQ